MNDNASEPKFEITDIAHPQYPWLHRVRALRDIGENVRKGDLGGYVQSEDNLSQQGNCWLYNDSICCDEAAVSGDSQLHEQAIVKGSALVSGSARVSGQAVIEDHAIVTAGTIDGHAFVRGFAQITANQTTKLSPQITNQALVYGDVCGQITVCGQAVILPGTRVDLPTTDTLRIDGNGVKLVWSGTRNGTPLLKHRSNEPER